YLPKAGDDFVGARCSGDFELLPQAVGEDFNLGSDGGFVVGKAGEGDADGMIFVSADVGEDERSVGLGDDQIRCAVVVYVGGDEGAGIFQRQLVGSDCCAYVLKSFFPHVAEDAQLRTFGGFDEDGEIDPSVIIYVDGGYAPCGRCALERQRYTLEALAVCVAPQADAWCAGVGHGYVHPSVFVVVEDCDAARSGESGNCVQRERLERACAAVFVNGGSAGRVGYDQVHGAVVVDVGERGFGGGSAASEAGGG